jgi:PadR family transcriptional regulator, regulatory protein PadR
VCDHKGSEGCHCHTGRMRGFVQPRLLLQLAKKPAHGYELMDALGQEGDDATLDPGTLYRTLRTLEDDGLVSSIWNTEGTGPARRVYQLTDQGVEYLHAWAITVQRNRDRLDRFLVEYERQFQNKTGE